MELGFLELNAAAGVAKADPSRPGLDVYRKELTKDMYNPKGQANLLNKKALSAKKVTIPKLVTFAKSRIDKIMPKNGKSAYQTESLIDTLIAENESMMEVIAD